MKQYLLMGTAVIALTALASPAEASDPCEARRNRAVIRRVQSAQRATYAGYSQPCAQPEVRSYGTRYSRPVIVKTSGSSYGSSGSCASEPGYRTSDDRGYRRYRAAYPRVSHDRLHDRIERSHQRVHVQGYRTPEQYRRAHERLERQRDRADRLRVRRVGSGSYSRDCR